MTSLCFFTERQRNETSITQERRYPPHHMSQNRLVEEMPVSFLCVSRKLQERPYEPLTSQSVSHAVAQQHTFRPPVYIAQETLQEFYRVIQGKCGVSKAAPGTTAVINGESEPFGAPVQAAAGVSFPAPIAGGPPSSSTSIQDYRLAQIRNSERHQKPAVTSGGVRICSYLNTREGCRRGSACPYLHPSSTATALLQSVTAQAANHGACLPPPS